MRTLYEDQVALRRRLPYLNYEGVADPLPLLAEIMGIAGTALFGYPRRTGSLFVHHQAARGALLAILEPLLVVASLCGVENMEEAVWQKYCNICPNCEKPVCECVGGKKGPHRKQSVPKPRDFSLEDFQLMLARIYPHDVPSLDPARQLLALAERFHHFQEEILEIMEEVVEGNDQRNLQDEFADAFAWLMALANTLGVQFD